MVLIIGLRAIDPIGSFVRKTSLMKFSIRINVLERGDEF
jgi:hypothetical protein